MKCGGHGYLAIIAGATLGLAMGAHGCSSDSGGTGELPDSGDGTKVGGGGAGGGSTPAPGSGMGPGTSGSGQASSGTGSSGSGSSGTGSGGGGTGSGGGSTGSGGRGGMPGSGAGGMTTGGTTGTADAGRASDSAPGRCEPGATCSASCPRVCGGGAVAMCMCVGTQLYCNDCERPDAARPEVRPPDTNLPMCDRDVMAGRRCGGDQPCRLATDAGARICFCAGQVDARMWLCQ